MRRPSSKATVRFLPVLILVLLAVLPAHVGSLWTGVVKLAMAEDAAKGAPAPPAGASASAGGDAASGQPASAPATTAAATAQAGDAPAPADAGTAPAFDPLTLTKSEIDVLQQLAKRREALDQRERAIKDREALLAATEQRITDEIQKMQQMKAEYEQVKKAKSDAEEANLRRLVTVYEAMKPEEAARIFETMDGTVLLDVVTRMGERRLAPVLAQMTPARAQALTVAMANRRINVAATQPGS
jgi:flagellar motility protein MotE (MotC chaperone)